MTLWLLEVPGGAGRSYLHASPRSESQPGRTESLAAFGQHVNYRGRHALGCRAAQNKVSAADWAAGGKVGDAASHVGRNRAVADDGNLDPRLRAAVDQLVYRSWTRPCKSAAVIANRTVWSSSASRSSPSASAYGSAGSGQSKRVHDGHLRVTETPHDLRLCWAGQMRAGLTTRSKGAVALGGAAPGHGGADLRRTIDPLRLGGHPVRPAAVVACARRTRMLSDRLSCRKPVGKAAQVASAGGSLRPNPDHRLGGRSMRCTPCGDHDAMRGSARRRPSRPAVVVPLKPCLARSAQSASVIASAAAGR